MKKQSQDLTNEQLHIEDAAAVQEEYSLEDIMNEFGGWSKRSEPRTPPLDTAQTLPEQKPEQSAPAEEADAPDTKIVRFPAQAKRFPEEKEEKPPKNPADFTGQTIRFTPIREEQTQQAEKPKIWTYQAEPDPEPAPPSDPKEAKKAARRAQRAQKEAQKRRRQLERHQKQQAKRAERRKEQPEREFSDCRAAYAYYAQGTFQRLRLFVSILLALVSIGLCYAASYPIGSYDFTANAESFSRMLLIIMVVQAFVAWDVALRGVRAACRLRYDHAGMLLVLTIACAVDAVIAIRDGRIAFCPAVTLQWCAALLGEYSMQLAKLRTLKAACSMNEPKAAVREEKAWHGEDCIFRSDAKPEEFVRELEIPDAGSRMMRIYAPVLTAVTLGLSVLSMLQAEDSFLWAWTALMIASFPAGMFLSFSRPFAAQARRLSRAGAAVGGWYGARMLGGECGIAIEDADLFPPQNVTQGGMKLYGSRPAPMVIGYANAVVQTAGSGLVPLFEQMMHDQNGRRYTVDTFRRYEGGGLGATIRGDVVLMGSIAFMKLMRVRVPEGTRLKQAVYLSVNGELTAVFALNYAPAESVRAGLSAVLRAGSLVPVLATRDFMITPQFLKLRYKIPPEHIEFPIVEERARLSSQEIPRTGPQGALMARSSFASFAGSVVSARTLRGAAIIAMIVALAGSVLGTALMFFLTFLGSSFSASCWNLFLYTVLWLIPGLLTALLAGRA